MTEKRICAKKHHMSRKKKPKTISETLREAIRKSDLSLYRISTDTGIIRSSLIRFLRGDQSLRLDKADLLAEYFGLEVIKRKGK